MKVRSVREIADVVRFIWHHPPNYGRRMHALYRGALFQMRGRILRRPTLAALGQSSLIEAHLHSTAASKAVYANSPEWPEMLVWQARLRPRDLFIDVGANVGSYSIVAAKRRAHVVAVEPQMNAIGQLARNASLNGYEIRAIQAVVLPKSGEVPFDFSGDTTAHVARPDAAGATVIATTLGDVLGRKTAADVKIDVEGAECLVIDGGLCALAEHRIAMLTARVERTVRWPTPRIA